MNNEIKSAVKKKTLMSVHQRMIESFHRLYELDDATKLLVNKMHQQDAVLEKGEDQIKSTKFPDIIGLYDNQIDFFEEKIQLALERIRDVIEMID